MPIIVEVKDLTKRFSEDVLAVDNISFQVEEGEVFGFLGPNGAGKSTTIKMLTTLLVPTKGTAKVAGLDLATQQDAVRKIMGLVPQDLTVDDDLSGRENMLLQADLYAIPRSESIQRIEELLEVVDLIDAADRRVKTYSGGMRKRLELAEGLIHHPKVLFLDEPTLGLDVQTRAAIWKYIKDLKAKHNITVFLTTHYLEEADGLCDRIAIIDHGKIIAMDTPAALKRTVGGDVIDLKAQSEKDIVEMVSKVEGVLDVKKENGSYRIKAENGEATVPLILKKLWDNNSSVQAVSVHTPSLDQAFLELTGKSLRDESSTGGFDKMAAARAARRRR